MDARRAKKEAQHESFKLIISQIMFVITFIINIFTTIGIVWIIFRLGLNKDPQSIVMINEQNLGSQQLVFNRDLVADTLVVQETLRTNSISHEHISIVGNSDRGPNAEISMNPDYILMQAESFGPNSEDGYSFRLPTKLEKLEVLHGANNVRAIRSPLQRDFSSLSEKSNRPFAHMEIKSLDELELSGNMGLRVYSRHIKVKSPNKISIQSREGTIVIRSSSRLLMPSIQLVNATNSTDMDDYFGNNHVTAEKYQLCISKGDGLIFKSQGSC